MTFDPEELFKQGVAAARAGDLPASEELLRTCVSANPHHVLALLNLGLVLIDCDRPGEAEAVLRKCVSIQPSVDSVFFLGRVLELNGKGNEALHVYGALLQAAPSHVPGLMRSGKIAVQKGDRIAAKDFFRRASELEPSNIEAGAGYAIQSFKDEPELAARMLTQLLQAHMTDDVARSTILLQLISYKEFYERIKRGLPPYHAQSVDEVFFKFSRAEAAEFLRTSNSAAKRSPKDLQAQITNFYSLFSARRNSEALNCLRAILPLSGESILECVNFDSAFFSSLETMNDEQLLKSLPPIEEFRTADFDIGHVVYMGCNFAYFVEFAAPMLRSLAEQYPLAQTHLHIMDATQHEMKALDKFCNDCGLTIAVTIEQPDASAKNNKSARAYYHAIRFIRFYFHLKKYNCPLWLMDVDALVQRDPRELFAMLGDSDTAFRVRPGRLEPWNQLNACIVGAAPTEASLHYFRLVAAYIAHFHQQDRLRWGIDQLAMYGVFEYLRDAGNAPSVSLLGERAIDYDYRDNGIVWCNSGRNKFLHLNLKPGVPPASLDPDRAKYLELFEKYYISI